MAPWIRNGLAAVVLSGCSTSYVAAQTEGSVAVGASISSKTASDSESRGAAGIGLLFRLGRGGEGWGFKYALPWYSAELDETIAGRAHSFGELKVRPIMGGYGYSKFINRRTKVSASVLGGYALNSFALQPTFDAAYRGIRGADEVRADVSNSLVFRPEVSTWIDLNKKVGVNISAGYMIARPTVTVTSSLGQDRRSIRADMFMVKIGAVYSIF